MITGNVTCGQGDIKCDSDNRCLPESKRCDGHVDCLDGQDETGCRTDCKGQEGQDGQEFYCGGQGRCIPMRFRCDGFADCTSGNNMFYY
jgi:hypothetical protein